MGETMTASKRDLWRRSNWRVVTPPRLVLFCTMDYLARWMSTATATDISHTPRQLFNTTLELLHPGKRTNVLQKKTFQEENRLPTIIFLGRAVTCRGSKVCSTTWFFVVNWDPWCCKDSCYDYDPSVVTFILSTQRITNPRIQLFSKPIAITLWIHV